MKFINDLDAFNQEIANGISVVDFTATWCGPCKQIAPVFENLAQIFTQAKFFKVDVDEGAKIAEKHNIDSMPTFKIFINGEEVGEFVGADEEGLTELVTNHCS